MAFTKAPTNSTYRTVDMEFTATSWPRSGSTSVRRDAEILNMYFDRNSNENQTRTAALVKRPGQISSGLTITKTTSASVINGYFQDDSSNYIYYSTDNKVFALDLIGLTNTQIATITGTETSKINSVGFCSFLTSTGTRYICFNNGSELWYHVVGSGVSTKVVDADYPASTYPTVVFLDGYLFVIKKDTGDIYNSDLDDPATWTAGNYVTAEINSDLLVAIAKLKNYLIAFGRDGIEFFYDAANVSGSPLGRNESYYKSVTLVSNLCTIGDEIIYVGRQKGQGLRVFKLDANENKPISNAWVERYLLYNGVNTLSSTGMAVINGFGFSVNGHNFYALSLQTPGILLICDLDNGFWYRWTLGTEGTSANVLEGVWTASVNTYGSPLILTGGKTTLTALSTNQYQDFGVNFTVSYTTEDYTSDTFNWKSCHRVGLYCDFPTSSGTSYAQISWSDDDGTTFSTPRDCNTVTNNPYITQCGRFRSRIWRIDYTDNYPWRVWGLSMDLNVGNI